MDRRGHGDLGGCVESLHVLNPGSSDPDPSGGGGGKRSLDDEERRAALKQKPFWPSPPKKMDAAASAVSTAPTAKADQLWPSPSPKFREKKEMLLRQILRTSYLVQSWSPLNTDGNASLHRRGKSQEDLREDDLAGEKGGLQCEAL